MQNKSSSKFKKRFPTFPKPRNYQLLVSTILLCIAVVASPSSAASSQKSKPAGPREQAEFDMESDSVRHPVAIPNDVLEILRADKWVQTCLEKGQSPSEIPADWFAASRIHLSHRQEGLVLVVTYGCLLGAHSAPYWIFRRTPRGHELILEVSGHGLRLLKSRAGGFREVQVYDSNAGYETVLLFKFDGKEYRLSKRTDTEHDQ
jgi:hypothetical protein